MRLHVAESGTTRQQFADNVREISEETVTEEMIDALFDRFDEDGDGEFSDVECEAVNRVLIEPLNRLRTALIVVDFQNDFVAGSLAIKNSSTGEDASEALVPMNRLLAECPFTMIVYTMDWHPYNHISFWEHCRNSDRRLCDEDRTRKLKPFDVVHFENPNVNQKLYPAHCIQNSWGADLESQLIRVKDSVIIKKGTQTYVDSYSAFKDNKKERSSELEETLRSEGIDAVFICGLAYDVCVAATANDGVDIGFLTALIADCSKGLSECEIQRVNEELTSKNAPILNSDDVVRIVTDKFIPWSWMCSLAGLPSPPFCSQ